jgi:hypothetical protein
MASGSASGVANACFMAVMAGFAITAASSPNNHNCPNASSANVNASFFVILITHKKGLLPKPHQ